MKALIVDDEKHVRDAIRMLVPWHQYGIDTLLEAGDGLAGIALIGAERPEIVFTDMMMPSADGGALLEWAATHAPACKIIVISGHDDFSYVRTAVKYGGVDYILKPIDATELNTAVSKAVASWHAEEEARVRNRTISMELNQLKPLQAEQALSKLISEPGSHIPITEALELYGLNKTISTIRVAILSFDMISPVILNKFGDANLDLLSFMLTNIANEVLRDRRAGCAIRMWGQENGIVFLLWRELEHAKELIGKINEAIAETLKTKFVFGIGQQAVFPTGTHESYQQARYALQHRNLRQRSSWCHSYESISQDGGSNVFFSSYEEKVRFAVQSGNKDHIAASLRMWFKEMDQLPAITPDMVRRWRQQFDIAKAVWLGQLGGGDAADNNEAFTLPVNSDGEFDYEDWKGSFIRAACEVSDRLTERDPNRSVIKDIARYIEQNAQEEITLQHISEKFYLSREYISRKFKQELNENLSDFMTRIRITRAKTLLANAPLKITQVAELSGFQDEKYFSKVFKKFTGQTPNEYRRSLQNGDAM